MGKTRAEVDVIFAEALGRPSEEARAAYLDQACAGDAGLRRLVQELLDAHGSAGSFLEVPAGGLAATVDMPEVAEGVGTVIGRYKLLQKIGEGGFGVVFVAEQREPVHRRVALKVIKPGMDTRQVIARFEAERQALALMDHPNIAHVFDAGTTQSGRPYFVMELIKGCPITKYCDERHLTLRERLELFVPVCQAIQHAHQKGIIHRDIKPSNVLVADYDECAVPKIIDFGVAKALGQQLTERSIYTDLGRVLGTVDYMSPEQAKLNQLDIDTRSDVYSLGVLLYELMAGETPFDRARLHSAAFDEVLRIIREEEPPKPSTRLSTVPALPSIAANRNIEPKKLRSLICGDLDWIVMRALEKERKRRYQSAVGLAADIERFLRDEPVEACPPSLGYKFRKFTRRNKAMFVTAALVSIALILGTVVSTGLAVKAWQTSLKLAKALDLAENETRRAEKETEKKSLAIDQKEQSLYRARVNVAALSWERADTGAMRKALDACPMVYRDWEWRYLNCLRDSGFVTFEGHAGHEGPVTAVAFSPDGLRLASAGDDRTVKIWTVATRACLFTLTGHEKAVRDVRFSPDGSLLASGSEDEKIKLWDSKTGRHLRTLSGHEGVVIRLAFSPDGTRLASAGYDDRTVRIWDVATGGIQRVLTGQDNFVTAVAFSPDGTRLLSGTYTSMKMWDVATWLQVKKFEASWDITGVSFSRDGGLIAASRVTEVGIWDAHKFNKLPKLTGHGYTVNDVAFSPDGDRIACCEANHTVAIWDVRSREKTIALRGRFQRVGWSPDGTMLACGGLDGKLRLLDLVHGQGPLEFAAHEGLFYLMPEQVPRSCAFSPQGKAVAAVGAGGTIGVWDAATGIRLSVMGDHGAATTGLAFSPDEKCLASASLDGTIKIWDWPSGTELRTLPTHMGQTGPVRVVAFDRDGGQLASTGDDGSIRLWRADNGKPIAVLEGHTQQVTDLAWCPLGATPYLASAGADGTVRVWDTRTRNQVRKFSRNGDAVFALAYSPDGQTIVSVGDSHRINFWDANDASAAPRPTRTIDAGAVSVAFASNGNRVFTAGTENLVRVWDRASGEEVLSLPCGRWPMRSITVAGDENRIAALDQECELRVWASRPELKDSERKWAIGLANACVHRASVSLIGRDYDKARADLDRAIVLAPEIEWAHVRRGDAYAGLGNYDRAFADYDVAAKRPSQRFHAWRSRGDVYATMGQYDKAQESYEQCLTRNPPEFEAWEPYLVLQLKARRVQQYRTACQRLLAQAADPSREPWVASLVAIWAAWDCALAPKAVDDFQPCISLAQRAVEQDPDNPGFHRALGAILYRAGDYDAAINALAEAIRQRGDKGSWQDWLFLAMAHHQLGHSDDAKKWLEKADKLMKEDAATKAKRAEEIGPSFWYHQLELELLHAEAESIIKQEKE